MHRRGAHIVILAVVGALVCSFPSAAGASYRCTVDHVVRSQCCCPSAGGAAEHLPAARPSCCCEIKPAASSATPPEARSQDAPVLAALAPSPNAASDRAPAPAPRQPVRRHGHGLGPAIYLLTSAFLI